MSGAGRPLLIGYGGGLNSLAVCLGLRDRGVRPDLLLFADTKGEKPETYGYLGIVHEGPMLLPRATGEGPLAAWLQSVDWPALTVCWKESPRTGDASLEAECLRRREIASRAYGMSSCAWRWKIEPQEKYLNHWAPAVEARLAGRKPTKVLGYDDGESHRSAKAEDDRLHYWYPLRDWGWDRDACAARVLAEGLPLPPKSACFYCPSSTKAEILELGAQHPDLMARALAMEDNRLAAAEDGSKPLVSVRGLGRYFSWREFLAADAEGRRRLPVAQVEACTMCADEGES